MRESRIRSEIFTVMIETTIRVRMKIAPIAATSATVGFVECTASRAAARGVQEPGRRRGAHPGHDGQHLAGEPAHRREKRGDQDDPRTTRSRIETGMRVA
jgi:hypothetical protein